MGGKLSYPHVIFKIEYLTRKLASKTPYELWKGYAPNIAYLKVWECLAKVLILEPKK